MKESEYSSLHKAERLQKEYSDFRAILSEYEKEKAEGDYSHPVFGYGSITPVIMFVGEAPGREEAANGLPFVGKAGKTLSSLLEMIGLEREQVYISNVVKYRPWTHTEHGFKNRTPTKKEIETGLPLLEKEIEIIHPPIIVTLGNTPLYALCKIKNVSYDTVGKMHGKQYAIDNGLIILFPAYHPASCIYNRSLKKVLEEDMLVLNGIITDMSQG